MCFMIKLFDDYDVIVNCTGAEAADLTQDLKLKPVRGQNMKVS